jgi:hypothetical protein
MGWSQMMQRRSMPFTLVAAQAARDHPVLQTHVRRLASLRRSGRDTSASDP